MRSTGQAACERHAKGLVVDPLPPRVRPGSRQTLKRKALAINPRAVELVHDDTSSTPDQARVVIDFGEAMIEDGHAAGGEILEMDLTSQGDDPPAPASLTERTPHAQPLRDTLHGKQQSGSETTARCGVEALDTLGSGVSPG